MKIANLRTLLVSAIRLFKFLHEPVTPVHEMYIVKSYINSIHNIVQPSLQAIRAGRGRVWFYAQEFKFNVYDSTLSDKIEPTLLCSCAR